MAIMKIEMRPEGTNDHADVLYPKTSVDMVVDLERYGVASGTNAYAVTIANTPALTNPLRVTVKFTNANTVGTGCTLNVNGLGAKAIIGANRVHIPVGTLKAGGIYSLFYDGTYFQLLGEGGEYGTAQSSHVLTPYTIGTESGIVTGTMPNRGALNQTITTNNGQVNISSGYYSDGVVKAQFANLIPGNVKSGVNIGGVVGTLEGAVYKKITIPAYTNTFSGSTNNFSVLMNLGKGVVASNTMTIRNDSGLLLGFSDNRTNIIDNPDGTNLLFRDRYSSNNNPSPLDNSLSVTFYKDRITYVSRTYAGLITFSAVDVIIML